MKTQPHRCPTCTATGAALTRSGAACMACGWRDAQRKSTLAERRRLASRMLADARRVYTTRVPRTVQA